jgi:hypothetical protein
MKKMKLMIFPKEKILPSLNFALRDGKIISYSEIHFINLRFPHLNISYLN